MATPAKPVRKMLQAAEAQTRILEAVDELFYREGARAVSVDEVVKRAGVNKMSVYRQFHSKEDLMLHYLARRDQRFWHYINVSLAKHPDRPGAQLRQLFADLAQRTTQPNYRGCPFVNIACEFPDPTHPARRAVAQNKRQLIQRLRELTAQAGARDARMLADGLAILIEGAYAASQTYSPDDSPLSGLPQVADTLLRAAGVND
ncbi:MAG: TetR/AcrR family transcriptional regulator [Paludibacterium sp.]|nr:TetR/AcrR family transcriptional regulator [Paludibacterium sp.]MBV8648774.1 TetR/AcrR family transcriptional regulator [Paludibacterium sp.]